MIEVTLSDNRVVKLEKKKQTRRNYPAFVKLLKELEDKKTAGEIDEFEYSDLVLSASVNMDGITNDELLDLDIKDWELIILESMKMINGVESTKKNGNGLEIGTNQLESSGQPD